MGSAYRKRMPNHLTIHKLIADIAFDQLAGGHQPHIHQSIGKSAITATVINQKGSGQLMEDAPTIPQKSDKR